MFSTVASGLSPNLEKDDILLALSLLLNPARWNDKSYISKLQDWFVKRFGMKKVYLFNAGRSALYLLLKSAGIGKGDEIIVQAFTCIGAIEPILWVGAKPVYADIERNSYNIDPVKLNRKVTKKTKAVIVQHTFGIPAGITEIDKIARQQGLLLIEDCAHSLGAKVDGKEIGTFGDAAFFSFGRDKVISSVFGGAAIIHQSAKFKAIDNLYSKLAMPGLAWTVQQLFHPVVNAVILPTYGMQLGKLLLALLLRFGLLSKPYSTIEYRGEKPKNYPQKLSPPLTRLALNQLQKLDKFNNKRRNIAARYGKIKDGAIYLRYPMLVKDPDKLYANAREKDIIFGRWYSNIIDPEGTNMAKFYYKAGTCPVAEEIAKKIINLPTYPRMTESEIKKVKNLICSDAIYGILN